jgi:hypothetical protein
MNISCEYFQQLFSHGCVSIENHFEILDCSCSQRRQETLLLKGVIQKTNSKRYLMKAFSHECSNNLWKLFFHFYGIYGVCRILNAAKYLRKVHDVMDFHAKFLAMFFYNAQISTKIHSLTCSLPSFFITFCCIIKEYQLEVNSFSMHIRCCSFTNSVFSSLSHTQHLATFQCSTIQIFI